MRKCKDLALQLFEHDDIDVIMGGGREWFVDRLDKRDLIQVRFPGKKLRITDIFL